MQRMLRDLADVLLNRLDRPASSDVPRGRDAHAQAILLEHFEVAVHGAAARAAVGDGGDAHGVVIAKQRRQAALPILEGVVKLVDDETTETVCHSLVDAFTYFEGVPLIAVFDNPKTIVTSRDGDRVKWNPTFGQFCAEAGIVPNATWPMM